MRACYILLVAAVSLIATSNAAEASPTAHLAAIDQPHEDSVGKRFLRSHQVAEEELDDSTERDDDDESEERGINQGTVDDVVSKLNRIVKGSKKEQVAKRNVLIKKWLNSGAHLGHDATGKNYNQLIGTGLNKRTRLEDTMDLVSAIKTNKRISKSLKTRLIGWLYNGKRLDDTDDLVAKIKTEKHMSESLKTRLIARAKNGKMVDDTDDLLAGDLYVLASAGNQDAQNKLFAGWAKVKEGPQRKALLESAFHNGQNANLKTPWEKYLASHPQPST